MPFKGVEARERDDQDTVYGPRPGLAEGEWVRYWRRLPHSLVAKMTSAATIAKVAPDGQIVATFDPGVAAVERLHLGIVDWALYDGAVPVVWERDKATVLMDGLDPDLLKYLGDHIGQETQAETLDKPDPATGGKTTQGEG